MALGFDLLQLEVFRHALAGPVSAQFRPHATRDGHHLGVDLRMRRCVTFQFIRHAQLQSAPLTRHFAYIVALLPTLQAVRGSVAFGLDFERCRLRDRHPAQASLKGVQQTWNVIIQLRARQRGTGGHVRITIYGLAPCPQDAVAPRSQVRSKGRQLCIDVVVRNSYFTLQLPGRLAGNRVDGPGSTVYAIRTFDGHVRRSSHAPTSASIASYGMAVPSASACMNAAAPSASRTLSS